MISFLLYLIFSSSYSCFAKKNNFMSNFFCLNKKNVNK